MSGAASGGPVFVYPRASLRSRSSRAIRARIENPFPFRKTQMASLPTDFSADPQVGAIRLPPHSIEAEQALIGGILLDNAAWERIADLVSAADFYRDDHRRIYAHIAKLVDLGKPADVVTVFESLEKSNEAEQA